MSEDTIYLRQFSDLVQASLREWIGINLADVRQLQDELISIGNKFNLGIIPENEAADFARETGDKALEYEIHAKEELEQLQEGQKKPVQQSPEVEKFINGLDEEKRNLIQSESDRHRQLPISAMENFIAELKQLREMAWYLTAHIQDYAATSEYRERRRAFLLTGETPTEPAPEMQPPIQGAAVIPKLTDAECLQKLVDTGFIAQNINIKDKTVYSKTRAVNAPKIYNELLRLTNDNHRAERIMRNNISGVEAGLKQYLHRLSQSNKE
jgi:hypothetical protein